MSTEQISFQSDHSLADIEEAKRLANEEQLRRSTDQHGEQTKKKNAYLVSAILEASVRPGWFKQGSSYVFEVLKVARKTTDGIALTATQAKERVASLGQQGIHTVNDVKHSFEVAGNKTIETAQDVKAKCIDAAQNANRKFERSASDISKKSLDTLYDAHVLMLQKLESAQDTATGVKANIQSTARQGANRVQGLVRSLSNSVMDTVNTAWHQLTSSSVTAYVVLEEERERLYRMNNDQSQAILNAFRVSALIKELAPEFYRPTSEPCPKYSTHLLEENERSRRIANDSIALKNASVVFKLIPLHTVSRPLPMAKAEIVEPITVARPLIATM